MCIAIVVPGGKRLDAATLRRCFDSNRDGAGIAYINRGRVMVAKGFMKDDHLITAYEKLASKFGDKAMLVHCRIATKGKVGKDNCHPFKFDGGAVVHNGSLWGGTRADEQSDTSEFVEDNGKFFSKEFIEQNKDAFERIIGFNRLAFLWPDGSFTRTLERSWTEHEGIFYSNTTFRDWRSYSGNVSSMYDFGGAACGVGYSDD